MVLLFSMAVVGVDAKLIPTTNELPVVSPSVPPRMLLAVELPIVFPDMVIEAAIPETLIPKTPPATAAVVPEEVKPPSTLFCSTIVPVEEQLIPTTAPCVVEGVAFNVSTPEEAPIVFAVTFPTLTLPAVIFIPHKIPFVVVAPLEVVKLIAVIVFP